MAETVNQITFICIKSKKNKKIWNMKHCHTRNLQTLSGDFLYSKIMIPITMCDNIWLL